MNPITFADQESALRSVNWLNAYMDEQETGVHFIIVERDGKYIIAVSQM